MYFVLQDFHNVQHFEIADWQKQLFSLSIWATLEHVMVITDTEQLNHFKFIRSRTFPKLFIVIVFFCSTCCVIINRLFLSARGVR